MVIFLKQEDEFGLVWNPLGIPFTSIKQYYWKYFEICSLTTIVVSSSVDADEEKIITVQLDGEESTLSFIDPEDDEV
jgi:hypothetical protein